MSTTPRETLACRAIVRSEWEQGRLAVGSSARPWTARVPGYTRIRTAQMAALYFSPRSG